MSPAPPPTPELHKRGCVKGGVLKSRLSFLETAGGPALVKQVLSRLTPGHRQLLSELIVAVGWYPFEVNAALDSAIASTMGGGAGIHRRMGAQSAVDSLGSAHKNLIRERDPHGLLKHSAQIHKLYYDTGYRTYEWVAKTSAVLRTFECKSYSAEDCQTNLGWHETALALCGARGVRVTDPRCRARGDDSCEYVCRWE